MENDIKKMFELYDKCYGKKILFDTASEDDVKHIYWNLHKIYHSDLNTVSTHDEIFLQYALEIFPTLVYSDDIKQNFLNVGKELNKIYDVYRKRDKLVLDPQKQEEEDYNKCKDVSEGHDRHMREMIKNNPELSKVLNNVYQRFIYLNTIISKETISRILQEKDLTRKNCEIIINKKKTLDNFSFQIKDITNYNTEEQERCLLTLKKIVDSFIKQIDQVEELSEINKSYYLTYQEISKLIAIEKINKEIVQTISKSNASTIEDYVSIKAQFCRDIDEVIAKRTKNKKNKISITKLDSKLANLTAYYEVKISFQDYKLKKHKELTDEITKNGFTIQEVGVDLKPLSYIDNYDEFNKQYLIISNEVQSKLVKLKVIEDIKTKVSKLPAIAVPQEIEQEIEKIKNYKTPEDITDFDKRINELAKSTMNKLDYLIHINKYIDEYLETIKDNPEYSFSFGNIKATLNEKRKSYLPLDFDYKTFNANFRIAKEKFEKNAKVTFEEGIRKKKKLSAEFSQCYKEGIFFPETEEQVKEKIDNIKTFGEFAKLKQDIILSEFRKQMIKLAKKIKIAKVETDKKIETIENSQKKQSNPFEIKITSPEEIEKRKELIARSYNLDKAYICLETISQMFDRLANSNDQNAMNNMVIIYPSEKYINYIKEKDNKEDYKKALKQMMTLISLDYENGNIEEIGNIVDSIYKELFLDKKQFYDKEQALNEATKNNREKHRR